MDRKQNIFDVIRSGDIDLLIEVVDSAFKEAAREASAQAHAMGIEVADGRAAEERRRKPTKAV